MLVIFLIVTILFIRIAEAFEVAKEGSISKEASDSKLLEQIQECEALRSQLDKTQQEYDKITKEKDQLEKRVEFIITSNEVCELSRNLL